MLEGMFALVIQIRESQQDSIAILWYWSVKENVSTQSAQKGFDTERVALFQRSLPAQDYLGTIHA